MTWRVLGSRTFPRHLLSGLAILPGLVWWLGWQPGFATTDTVDQLTQARTEQYFTNHPPIHTAYLDLLSLDATRPGLVTLFQLLVLGVLLVYATRRVIEAGVPAPLAVGAALVLGVSPAVAPTTLALWKDIPFGLLMLLAWIELLGIAGNPWHRSPWPWLRLGAALGGVWVLRGNGPITVLLTMAILAVVWRRQLREPLLAFGAIVAVVAFTALPLAWAVEPVGGATEPAQVFLPDVAGSYNREPETFTAEDLALLEALAPLEVWNSRYDCYHSTPLLFDASFDFGPVAANPGPYRQLELEVLTRDPDSVLQHRLCASNFVYWPVQPGGVIFHRLPYFLPENEVGLVRDPVWNEAFVVTDAVWHWAESDGLLWLTWRPALVVLPALVAVALFATRPAGRRFLIPSSLFLAHLVNVAVTSPGQEFRYAYPLYLLAVFTLVLVYPALRARSGGRHLTKPELVEALE